MDDIDRANELTERATQIAIANLRARILTAKDSADNCEECGLEISSERQIAVPGCTLCVVCAGALEAKLKHFRGR